MINLIKYLLSIVYKIKKKKTLYRECDIDFWDNIYLEDLEEVKENVRYCFTIYEPIN